MRLVRVLPLSQITVLSGLFSFKQRGIEARREWWEGGLHDRFFKYLKSCHMENEFYSYGLVPGRQQGPKG